MAEKQAHRVCCYLQAATIKLEIITPPSQSSGTQYENLHRVWFFHLFGQHFKDPNCVTDSKGGEKKRSRFKSAVYNSVFWSSSWFPWSFPVPSLTLLYFKPVEWDNLLGEKEVSKPALFWVSPGNVFLLMETFKLYIKTSVDDCTAFTNTAEWKEPSGTLEYLLWSTTVLASTRC